jgi:hypothetical protein
MLTCKLKRDKDERKTNCAQFARVQSIHFDGYQDTFVSLFKIHFEQR